MISHRRSTFLKSVLTTLILLAGAGVIYAKASTDGFIYGKITTRTGNNYIGMIRWGDEEAFWDDRFNSLKEDLPFAKYLEQDTGEESYSDNLREDLADMKREKKQLEREKSRIKSKQKEIESLLRSKYKNDPDIKEELADLELELIDLESAIEELNDEIKRSKDEIASSKDDKIFDFRSDGKVRGRIGKNLVEILGGSIQVNLGNISSRVFIARFGDIKMIRVIGSEDAEITMKNGSTYVVSGYSNDVGNTINIDDQSLGRIELKWKKIDTIEFLPTPSDIDPKAFRIRGKVVSDAGEFSGSIQWDSEECLSTDKLDGDSEDGRMSIDMGKIRKIERRNRNSAWVELRDGRRMLLDGTNDVDGSIRGILVEDPKVGRVKVSWDAFEYAEFDKAGSSGPGYKDFPSPKELRGKAIDINGEEYRGKIVYDIDESESWEMLNGNSFDVEYEIPFSMIKSVTPRSRNASIILLRNGKKLRLDSSQDVSSSNDGILIFEDKDKDPVYIEWDNLEKVEFSW